MVAWDLLGPLLVWLTASVVVLTYVAGTSRPSASLAAEVASARRHSILTAGVALVALVTLGVGLWFHVAGTDDVNGSRLAAVSPLLASSVALVALVLGEATWPRPQGTLRSARLVPRRAWSLTSRPWCVVAAGSVSALVGVVVSGGVVADESGRRLVGRSGEPGAAFPGWHYGVPQLVVVGVAVLLALTVARLATWRPAVVDADAEMDTTLRRASIVRGLRMLTVGALICLSGDLFIAGEALRSAYVGEWPSSWGLPSQGVAVVALFLAMALALVPAPRLGRRQEVTREELEVSV
jgi:hypothetical protein